MRRLCHVALMIFDKPLRMSPASPITEAFTDNLSSPYGISLRASADMDKVYSTPMVSHRKLDVHTTCRIIWPKVLINFSRNCGSLG